ncbi:tetratricopeptide repeat protein [Candidatus Albibeggiatoa sp. nov. NOAA]|uniref:tetratricopeptide repeat protein n=1 Tax=Candidatus Albibeggiatoa sp. nov. NOAA TaxID=3162724 RepID=UPI0032F96A22|nr:tetratricopeptide repeat protein [Thiotrichaceae bacterium]
MNIGQTLHTAQQLHQQGRLQEACGLYQKIIQIQPRQVDAIHLMGVALAQAQQPQQAIAYFQQAVKLKPKVAIYHSHLGNALQTVGQLESALQHYQNALRLERHNADTYSNLGGVYVKLHNLSEAEQCYQQAIKLNARHTDAYHNLSIVLVKLEKYQVAREICQKALKLKLAPVQTYVDLARIEIEQEQWQQAEKYLQHALQLQSNHAEAHYFLGVLEAEQGGFDQAERHYKTALKHNSHYAEAYLNLGNIYVSQQKLDVAQHFYQKAIQAKPHFPDTYANLARIKHRLGETKAAIKHYQTALQLRPHSYEFHQSYSQVLLATGQFKQGWQSFLYRPTRLPSSVDFKAIGGHFEVEPLAQDLTGKHIFIHKDQGLGDELLFLRFAAEIKRRGAKLTYQCGNKIKTMLQRLDWIDTVIDADKPSPTDADAKYLVGDLPLALGMDQMAAIPKSVQLSVLSEKLATVTAQLPQDGKPIIGLTWRAGQPTTEVSKKFKNKVLQKEVPLDLLIEALRDLDAHFVILQRHPIEQEVSALKQALSQTTYDFTHFSDDLESMLALMSSLDDYVGVSNTNLHLLIGLNKSARVLMPNPADWRWMSEGDYSPWFDGFKIYRQTTTEDWDDCFKQLKQDLTRAFMA